MYSIVREDRYLLHMLIDKEEYLSELPVSPDARFGSLCECLENGKVFILNNENKWVVKNTTIGGGTIPGDGGIVDDEDMEDIFHPYVPKN